MLKSIIKLTGACLVVASINTDAALLFDNGSVTGGTGYCTQDPISSCGGTGAWTYYDNFSLDNNSTITGFDYTEYFAAGDISNYQMTNWSIWSSDQFATTLPDHFGQTTATSQSVSNILGNPAYLLSVNGLNINLAAGTYWLGINNTVSGGAVTSAASAVPVVGPIVGLPGSKVFHGTVSFADPAKERSFQIYGAVVPLPAAIWLFGSGLIGLLGLARRKT